jgi:hypothetical protein
MFADLAEDVVVAGLLQIRQHDLLGVGVGLGAGEPELLRRPQAEELIATGGSQPFSLQQSVAALFREIYPPSHPQELLLRETGV